MNPRRIFGVLLLMVSAAGKTTAAAQRSVSAVVLRTDWPVTLPCAELAAAHVRRFYLPPDTKLVWRSADGARRAELPTDEDSTLVSPEISSALRYLEVSPPPPMPGREPGNETAEGEQARWYVDWAGCAAAPNDTRLSWSCGAEGCTTLAVYPIPDIEPGIWSQAGSAAYGTAARRLAAGKIRGLVAADDVRQLERTTRELLGRLIRAITTACVDERCAPELVSAGRSAEAIAATREWRVGAARARAPIVPGFEMSRGGIATFAVSGMASRVELHCGPEPDTEGEAVVCGVRLPHVRPALAYGEDVGHGQQAVHFGKGHVNLDWDSRRVALDGKVLALRP